MPTSSGLSAPRRIGTRKRFKRAAILSVNNASRIHYTQKAARWEGIAKRLHAKAGQYPRYADCSSSGSWYHWDATRLYKLRDYLNDANWTGGYTGTQTQNGKRLSGRWLLVGDAVFYGGTVSVPGHVAWVVKGGPVSRAIVVSHGSEAGPMLLRATYRTITQMRRHI